MELIVHVLGWLLGRLFDDPPAPSTSDRPARDDPPREDAPRGGFVVRWSTFLLTIASIGLTIAVPVLWATGTADGLTLVGAIVGALIAARAAYLLARYERNKADALTDRARSEPIR